jgi:hypothetical protein
MRLQEKWRKKLSWGPLSHAHDLHAVKAKKTPQGPTHTATRTTRATRHRKNLHAAQPPEVVHHVAPTCMPCNLTFSLMQ